MHYKLFKKICTIFIIVCFFTNFILPAFAADDYPESIVENVEKKQNINGVFNLDYVDYSSNEGDKTFQVKVLRDEGTKGQVAVDVHILDVSSIKDEDYIVSGFVYETFTQEELGDLNTKAKEDMTWVGRLFFEDGEKEKEFEINLIDDEEAEGTEIFMLALENPIGGGQLGNNSSTAFSILDNEPEEDSIIEFSEPHLTVDGDSFNVTLEVVRNGGEYQMVTVDYITDSKLFSQPIEGTLAFMPDEIQKTIDIPLESQNTSGEPITFMVHLQDCKGGDLGKNSEAQVTVSAVDTENVIQLASSELKVSSDQEKAVVSVISTGEIKEPITVNYRTEEQTAVAGRNYKAVEGLISFEPGEREKSVVIDVYSDTSSEKESIKLGPKPFMGFAVQNEKNTLSFDFVLTGVSGGNLGEIQRTRINLLPEQGSIEPTDKLPAVGFSKNNYYFSQGKNTGSIKITRQGSIDGVTKVLIKTSENTAKAEIDYQPVNTLLTFKPGETEKDITMFLLNANASEEKSFFISLDYIDGGKLKEDNQAEVYISPAARSMFMMQAAVSGGVSDLHYTIPLGKDNWKNGVRGKYTSNKFKTDNIVINIIKKGWGIDKNYDSSVVTKDYYDLTGYSSVVLDWESVGNSGQVSKFVITDNSQGNRNENGTVHITKGGKFGRQITELKFNLEGSYFFRFNSYNRKAKKSSTTLHNVTLEKRIYELKPVSVEHGSITFNTDEGYLGREIQITAHPNKGYQFEGYKLGSSDDINAATGRNFGKFVITQDLLKKTKINNGEFIITPVFSDVKVPVQIIAPEGGSVLYNDNAVGGTTIEDLPYNETIELKAEPNAEKNFVGWEISGQDGLYNNNPLKLTLQEENYVITSHFTGVYSIQINKQGDNGTVSTNKTNYQQGEIAVLSAAPQSGYIAKWNIGVDEFRGNKLYLQMDGNKSVTVEFISKTEKTIYYPTKVSGRVVDEKGQALPGVKVYLQDKETVTDRSGYYTFTKVAKNEGSEQIAIDDYVSSGRACVVKHKLDNYLRNITFRLPLWLGGNKTITVLQLPDIVPERQSANLSMKVQKVESVYSFSGDVNDNPIEIKDENLTFTATVAWNGAEPGHVDFLVKGKNGEINKTITVNAGENNPNLVAVDIDLDDTFSVSDRLEVQAVDASGKISETVDAKIIAINPVPEVDFNDVLNMDTPMPIPDGMPFFKGAPEFGVGNMSFSVENEDGAFVVYGGVARTLRENGEKADKPDNILGYLIESPDIDDVVEGLDTYEKIKNIKAGSIKPGIQTEFSMSAGVKLVWLYDEIDEEWKIAGGYLVVTGEGEAKKVFYFMTPIGVPLFASFAASLGAELVLGPEVGGFTGSISPELALRVAGGVGIEGLLAGEVWGKGTLGAEFTLKVKEDPDWSAELGAALGLKLVAFCFEPEWTIWDDSIQFPQTTNTMSLMAMSSEKVNWEFKPINRSYLKNQQVTINPANRFKIMSADFDPVENLNLIESTTPNSDPRVIQFDDKMLVVYLMDPGVEERSEALNSSMAVYTMYKWDESQAKYLSISGEEPVPLADDGTADQNPYVFVTDDKVVVTWASASKEFDDENDINNFLGVAKSYDIQAKFYNRNTAKWSDVHKVTNDQEFYGEELNDIMPRIVSYKDPETEEESIMITYIKSEYSNQDKGDSPMASMMNATQQLCYRLWDGNEWYNELMTWENPETGETVSGIVYEMALTDQYKRAKIPTIDMISYDGLGVLTYMQDGDGDAQTTEDQEIYLQYYAFPGVLAENPAGGWTEPIRLTSNDIQDTNPRVGLAGNDKSYIFWYSGDKIVYYPLKELYDEGFNRDPDGDSVEDILWTVRDGYQPETAIIDDSESQGEVLSGEMKDFEFTVGQDGNIYILWGENSGDSQEIYMSVFHALADKDVELEDIEEEEIKDAPDTETDGIWSKKYQLTQNKAINRNFRAAVTEEGKLWVVYNKVNTNISELDVEDDWDKETVFGGKDTDLCLTKFEPFSKFEVEIESLGDTVTNRSETLDFAVKVNNTGVWEVNNIEVTLIGTSGDNQEFGETKKIENPIQGGDSAVVNFSVPNIPNLKLSASATRMQDIEPKRLFALETLESKNDELQLITAPKLKLVKQEMIRNSNSTYTFELMVTNDGTEEAMDTVVNLYLNVPSVDESTENISSIISSIQVENLAVGESKEVVFENIAVSEEYFDKFNLASVTAEAVTGEQSSYCEMLINNNRADSAQVRNAFMDRDQLDLPVGEIGRINVSLYPQESESDLKWSSSDPQVVQVAEDSGYLYAVSEGNAEITVTTVEGGFTDTCMITVLGDDNGNDDHNNRGGSSSNSNKVKDQEQSSVGTISSTTENGKTVTTINVTQKKLEEVLEAEESNGVVTISTQNQSDVVVGELDAQTLKYLKQEQAVLQISTGEASYLLPATQIDIDAISQEFGHQVAQKDIKVTVTISKASEKTVENLENDAVKGRYTIISSPVNFNITCSDGIKDVQLNKFKSYIERTIVIPEGINLQDIITGVIVNPDGSISHVPTKVVKIEGKYYASINSLTNSTYTVIKYPVNFSDVKNHWSEEAVNEMGSRKIISGIGDNRFAPQSKITRAEFAAITIRALGLVENEDGSIDQFNDIKESDWFSGAVNKAHEYSLINGYNDGSFKPNTEITREEAMIIMAKAMKLAGTDTVISAPGKQLAKYKDKDEISIWAKEAVAACVKYNIARGNNLMLQPKEKITRAETAVMVLRMLQQAALI